MHKKSHSLDNIGKTKLLRSHVIKIAAEYRMGIRNSLINCQSTF